MKANRTMLWMSRMSAPVTARLLTLVRRIEPSSFTMDATEVRFLNDFRQAGLSGMAGACCAAIAGYFLIGSVDIIFNGWSTVEAIRRLLPIALLSSIVLLVVCRPEQLLQRYRSLLGGLGLAAYVCSVAITHFYREDDPTAVVNPTALIGLWIIYGFVRLPLRITLTLSVVGGVFALFGSRVTNMSDAAIRTMIYLLVGNTLGLILARSIEVRERELFKQKRILEDAHDELGRRSVLAEQASAEKTRLVAAVGHDLRQPMMAATLHTSVLIDRVRGRDAVGVERQAERVSESIDLLRDTLEHLLLAARYDAGLKQVWLTPTSISRVLKDLYVLCSPQIAKGHTELMIRLPPADTIGMTDRKVLLRALVNLVSNAIKFGRMDESVRSRVVVRTAVRDGICQITVLDNGIGIAPGDVEKIWQPFAQLGSADEDRQDGLGLGLYLVRQSLLKVPRHEIRLSSVPGRGTRFVVSLPVVSEEGLQTERVVEAGGFARDVEAAARLRGAYVLLIEDDPRTLAALHVLFEEWGVLFSSGGNLKEALRAHARTDRRVDAIVADYRLPGKLNGIHCVALIRRHLQHSPHAVLMTAELEIESVGRGLLDKMTLVQKPFDPEVLRGLLIAAVASAQDDEQQLLSQR